jgi:hypothetical protein
VPFKNFFYQLKKFAMSKEMDNEEELFSNDPDEQLRMENEILKLKLKAELGGDFEPLMEVPAEIENFFLKNVLAFEHEHANTQVKTIYTLLGEPEWKKESEIDDNKIQQALENLEELLAQKGIEVDYLAYYPLRLKYSFITEELFLKEAAMMSVPGMTTHYIYEEFHPNHEYDIKANSELFIKNWFNKSFNEYATELATTFFVPEVGVLQRAELFNKFAGIFDSYTAFENAKHKIENTNFELFDEGRGMGFSEGLCSYDAILENGERLHVEGPFKLYFNRKYDFWEIVYFVWPGFTWM